MRCIDQAKPVAVLVHAKDTSLLICLLFSTTDIVPMVDGLVLSFLLPHSQSGRSRPLSDTEPWQYCALRTGSLCHHCHGWHKWKEMKETALIYVTKVHSVCTLFDARRKKKRERGMHAITHTNFKVSRALAPFSQGNLCSSLSSCLVYFVRLHVFYALTFVSIPMAIYLLTFTLKLSCQWRILSQ